MVELSRLSGGASRETWSFVAVDQAGERRRLILRRDPPAGITRGMQMERALLVSALAAGVPVPAVVDGDDSSLILEHVEGETIPRRILRDDIYAAARDVVASQAGEALADVHRLPVDELAPVVPDSDEFDQYRSTLHSLAESYPVFEFAFRRLEMTRPPRSERVVVHGDFRMGNLSVGADGLRAVLDWELAHIGDPLEDLGWFCVRAWRFGSALPAGGVGSYDEFVGAYERASGQTVDRDALRWWEAFGTLRWGVICAVQASLHLSGAMRSVELAAIGRRVCEVEWDLLGYLR